MGAASPRPPSWVTGHRELSAGVLGETALPRFIGLNPAVAGIAHAKVGRGIQGGGMSGYKL